ncbi:MAG: MFS transporter, partial [Chlamydiia bacterium]|nr:MFS transporter [Chlamydiia bacterium]
MRVGFGLLLMWLSHFLVDFMIGIFSVYKTLAGLDLAKAGAIAFFSAMFGEGLQIFSGSLSDSGYRKPMLILGVLLVCANAMIVYVDSYWLIFTLVLINYIGSGCFHPSAASFAGSILPHRRGLCITIFASGGALGLALSQIGFYSFYRVLGSNLWVMVIPSVALALFILTRTFTTGEDKAQDKAHVSMGAKRFLEIFSLFKIRDMRLLYLSLVCNQALFWGMIFLLPDLLKSRGFGEWLCYGGGHCAMILGAGCAMVPAAWFADRVSPRRVMMAAMCCSMIFHYSLLMFAPSGEWVVLSWLFFLGAALGLVAPVGIAYGTRLFPGRPGLVSAFLMGMVWCISESMGPGGSGYLAHLFGGVEGPEKALICIGVL